MPNTLLLLAAVLTVAIGIAHSWIGERRLIGPLLSPGSRAGILATSGFARRTLRFAWHITTLAWWGMAAVLFALSRTPLVPEGRMASAIIGATFVLSGLISLVAGRGRHLSWPFFLAIGALSLAPVL
jgi:peptidoglycan/LPS O-acetylase OafA/YrhL